MLYYDMKFFMTMNELQGTTVSWEEYFVAVQSHFGFNTFDYPMLDLNNLKQTDSVMDYYMEFSTLFHHVQLCDPMTECQALRHIIWGLWMELQEP